MKTRLPKSLLVALMSTMLCATTIASAANVADVEGTVSNFTSSYPNPNNGEEIVKTYTPIYVGSDTSTIKSELEKYTGGMRNIVYSSTSSQEVNWGTVTVGSTLCVREGELIIKDSNITKTVASGTNHLNMQISGKNASLVLDNTSYSCTMKDTLKGDVMHVGGHSGAGALTLQNNSHLDVTTWLIIGIGNKSGYEESAGYKLYNTPEGASSDTYVGDFRHSDGAGTVFMRDIDYGTGTLNITSGSTLTVGGYIGLRDGTINITGAGSTLTTGNGEHFQANANTHGDTYSDMIGRSSGCVSIVRIEDGGVWNAKGHLTTGSRDAYEAKSAIYVDGAGSALNVGKIFGLGYGETGIHGTVVSTELYVTNGGLITVGEDMVVGPVKTYRGANPTYVYVDEQSNVQINGNFVLNEATTVTPDENGILHMGRDKHIKVDATGFETNFENHGNITCGSFTMNGGNLYSTGTIDITGEMTLIGGSITLGISEANTEKAAITAGDVIVATADNADYVIQLTALENLKAGKYLLLETEEDTSDTTGTSGKLRATAAPEAKLVFSGLEGMNGLTTYVDETGNVYLVLDEQLLLTRDPQADAIQAANWGVYKSSQAFTSLLWAPRTNAVVVKDTANGKSSILSTAAKGRTLAWGSVYSSFARHSSSGAFAGAEYSIFGGAIGVEREFASGRSVGAAFGYDWGKTSPFTTSRVDQDSWHAALYGRAAEWKLGKKGSVAIDWSAAVGSTTSEHKALGSDWTQENIQLDARATYSYALTERTALSAFVGAQYYAQNDDSTEKVKADSLQNLRLMLGAGISHKLTEKTTLFGEAMIYNDSMRHNPDAMIDGFNYGSGANPGRLGGSVTAGAQYQLTPDWTLRGSYSYEGAEDNNEHRVNVGAVYSF